MKKSYLFLLPLLVAGYLFLSGFGGGSDSDYPGGSPAGYTGSPGDGQDCKDCHGGSVSTVAGMITSNIPPAGYTPGTSYTITVTVTCSGSKGFEVSPQNEAGALLGTLTAGTGNKLVGSGKYVTQSSATSAATATWSFGWTAPAAGTGTVTFYGAFTVNKPVTKLSTLEVNEDSPLSVLATATPAVVCAGQTSQLDATSFGGSGSYTYTWTSNPAGFTSALPNPVVTPAENTTYTVTVSDGLGTANASAGVTVTPLATVNAGEDTTYCTTVTEIPNSGAATYYSAVLWSSSGDGTFSDAGNLNPVYYPSASDKANGFVNLYLSLIPIAPCLGPVSDGRHIIFDPCSGIPSAEPEAGMTVYPNPASEWITIKTTGLNGQSAILKLVNSTGTVVHESTIPAGSPTGCSLNTAIFPKGIYLLHLINGSKTRTGKVVIL